MNHHGQGSNVVESTLLRQPIVILNGKGIHWGKDFFSVHNQDKVGKESNRQRQQWNNRQDGQVCVGIASSASTECHGSLSDGSMQDPFSEPSPPRANWFASG